MCIPPQKVDKWIMNEELKSEFEVIPIVLEGLEVSQSI